MAIERSPTNPLTGKPLGPHWPQLAAILQRHCINLVVDIGANIGQYGTALRASGYAGRIVSVEPLSAPHAELERAAARDGNWVAAPRVAVGAVPGRLTINVSAEPGMSSALPFTVGAARVFDGDRTVAQETVSLTTVDALLAEYAAPADRVFVKSDTQGYDLEVLRGAAGSLDRIVGLQVEASLCQIYEGQPDWHALVEIVEPRGFAIHLVAPGYFSKRYGRLMEMDLIFFRDPPAS